MPSSIRQCSEIARDLGALGQSVLAWGSGFRSNSSEKPGTDLVGACFAARKNLATAHCPCPLPPCSLTTDHYRPNQSLDKGPAILYNRSLIFDNLLVASCTLRSNALGCSAALARALLTGADRACLFASLKPRTTSSASSARASALTPGRQ